MQPWYGWERLWKRVLEVAAIAGLAYYCYLTRATWQVAENQWSDLRENFGFDERAWAAPSYSFDPDKVFLEGDASPVGKMFNGDAAIRVTNTGKSPILRTETNVWVEFVRGEDPPIFNWTQSHNLSYGGLIFPGKSIVLENHRLHMNGQIFDPTGQELMDFKSGTNYVAAYGYIMYLDKFGSHWTRFCSLWHYVDPNNKIRTTQNALSCIMLNKVGDGDNALSDLQQHQ